MRCGHVQRKLRAPLVADEGTADREEGFVDVGASVVAAAQAAVLVQPADRALDHPAVFAKARSVGLLRFGEPGRDATFPQGLAVPAAVISAVGEQLLGPELAVPASRRAPVNERYEPR
jgi:hypothetical protein